MTQRQSRIMAGEMDADEFGGRWRRRLVRLIALTIFLWLGIKALFAPPGSPWIWAFGLYILLWLLSPLLAWWAGRRRRTVWRRDGRMFEPSLPRPVSDIPEEQEWTLPFHPLIRVPLALLLMGLMYWVLVIHQMQLPGHWLVATTIVTIINLWSWREPLVLVALVAVGVLLMTIVGWIINHLPIEAAIAVLVLIPVVVIVAVHELRKRKLKSQA
jgi:hypothetical protein